jgi:hypothetical protein
MRAPLLTLVFLLSAPAMAETLPPRLRSPVLAVRSLVMAVDADGALRPADDRNIASAATVRSSPPNSPSPSQLHLATAPCPPPRLSLRDARALVRRIAEQERFFPDFILAVAETESGFDAGKASARGHGLMQLSEARARASQVDRCDPAQNVLGGVRALRDLHARYRNPFYILADWHAGEEALLDADGLPPRRETLRFVADVMDRFHDWPALREGRVAGTGATGPSRTPSARTPSASATSEAPGPVPSAAALPPLRNGGPVPWRSGFVASFD